MLNYCEIHLVDHCNLNCKGCSHFSCIAPEKFYDLEDFKKNMSILAKKEDLRTLRLMGGEPLLHPQWLEFCKSAREIFPRSEIVLVTNGILNRELDKEASTLNQLGIEVCRSDYGLNINELEGVKTKVTHDKTSLYNISLDLEGAQNAEDSFKNCDLANHNWYFIKNDRIFTCCIFANIDIFKNYFGVDIEYDIDDVSIQFTTHSAQEIELFLCTPHKACRYCNTRRREHSYGAFARSKKEIEEWI